MIQISRTSFILPIYLIKMKLLYSFYLDGNAPTQPLGHPSVYMLYATLIQDTEKGCFVIGITFPTRLLIFF